jgi:predicted DNA-binding antitoxin AbrB/MazE fold protein
MSKESARARTANVIDMAFNFTAMARVFAEGSKEEIVKQLGCTLDELVGANSQSSFDDSHSVFCTWFCSNIKRSKYIVNASYGQGAKIIDVVSKVFFYYCQLPNQYKSTDIVNYLHGAVDTDILSYIKKNNPGCFNSIRTIADINDKKTYDELQQLLKEMKDKRDTELSMVEYEDILRSEQY